ncbi:hypothetical protein [Paenibacillus sp. NPDC058174]|uniref:hypothetical protein n=1 Tax=Paenibacillus sp. NPDC058174 TaxID=3346366 RepID=UPI0036DE3D5D
MVLSFMVIVMAALWGAGIVRRRLKLRQIRESVWAIVILVLGTTYCVCMLMQVQVPNPVDWITELYKPISKPITDWITEEME